MIEGKKILAIIPARGGSKGIPLKNMKSVGGIPLIVRVSAIVKQCDIIDKVVVSTDHYEIAELAKRNNLEVPFYRPDYLSGDLVSDLDVLTHALLEMEKLDNTVYEIILMLQPTSPFRTPKQVTETVKKLIKFKADSVWTISLTDSKSHPKKQLIIKNNLIEFYTDEGSNIIARQQLNSTYHKNGLAYAITRECLINQRSIKGTKCVPFIIEGYTPNIDTILDIEFAEFLIKKKYFHE